MQKQFGIKIHFEIPLLREWENHIFIHIYYIYSHLTQLKWTNFASFAIKK